jgi:hypothetical protein
MLFPITPLSGGNSAKPRYLSLIPKNCRHELPRLVSMFSTDSKAAFRTYQKASNSRFRTP